MAVLYPEEAGTQNSIGPKKTSDRDQIQKTRTNQSVVVEWTVTCSINLSEEIARSKWPSGHLFLCAVWLSEVCVKLFVLCILPRGMKY